MSAILSVLLQPHKSHNKSVNIMILGGIISQRRLLTLPNLINVHHYTYQTNLIITVSSSFVLNLKWGLCICFLEWDIFFKNASRCIGNFTLRHYFVYKHKFALWYKVRIFCLRSCQTQAFFRQSV